jgi:hypothetical protein
LHVGVERPAEAAAAAAAGDHDAVDVEEARVALAEPGVVPAVVLRVRAEPDQEAGKAAVAFGDADLFRGADEATEAVRVDREDGGAGGVVDG